MGGYVLMVMCAGHIVIAKSNGYVLLARHRGLITLNRYVYCWMELIGICSNLRGKRQERTRGGSVEDA
jgi:hypothetical protein